MTLRRKYHCYHSHTFVGIILFFLFLKRDFLSSMQMSFPGKTINQGEEMTQQIAGGFRSAISAPSLDDQLKVSLEFHCDRISDPKKKEKII